MWELVSKKKGFTLWRRKPLVRTWPALYEWAIGGYWQGVPVEPTGALVFPNRKEAEKFGRIWADC